jgi:hypothetical protein
MKEPLFFTLKVDNMKLLTIILCSGLTGLTAPAHAAPAKLENIKQIVCESTVSYDEDTPNEKKPTHGVKTFTPGSRKDVKPRPSPRTLMAAGKRLSITSSFTSRPSRTVNSPSASSPLGKPTAN